MQALLEVWEQLPYTEKDNYSIFSLLSESISTKSIKDPLPKRDTKKKPLESLYILRYHIFDEQVSTPDIFGIMNKIEISSISQCDDLEYSIYISDIQAANDLTLLRNNDINSILTIGYNKPLAYPSIKGGYKHLALEDNGKTDLLRNLPEICSFLEKQLKKGNTLVHCLKGQNRSCAVVIGFLMKKYSLRYENALEIVKKSRTCCEISEGLAKQLSCLKF
ncbi:hypothetical protein SteCoe_167 [Stentor coeruleus]|uniref:Protein-serine/threonine phosphatase n=1 Tax=Stentor coeruleus TaxID=5963 RepID=A0A1R2D4M5_9CILI|nr:hypothetical protein SteCoe_167 [Stentor coeruleus]